MAISPVNQKTHEINDYFNVHLYTLGTGRLTVDRIAADGIFYYLSFPV